MDYTPNNWVILKLTNKNKEIIYKILAGWSGGYLQGASWRINSGITKVLLVDDYYHFFGNSGSVYKCHKNNYGMDSLMSGVYLGILEDVKNNKNYQVTLLENKDFSNLIAGET